MPDPDELDLDGAISADLDGDLDAWCADTGVGAATVRARLFTPEALARRADLEAARAALAAPVPALDDPTRRRLVQGALSDPAVDVMIPQHPRRSGTSDHPRRVWAVLGGVAAAVLLVVGVVALVNRGGDGDGGAKSATASAPTGNLGDVGNLDQKRVDDLVRGGGAPTASDSATSGTAAPGAEGFTRNPESVPAARVGECADRFASEGTVRFRASGDFQGRPAVIVGVDTATRTIVFVVAADDCTRVLYSASR